MAHPQCIQPSLLLVVRGQLAINVGCRRKVALAFCQIDQPSTNQGPADRYVTFMEMRHCWQRCTETLLPSRLQHYISVTLMHAVLYSAAAIAWSVWQRANIFLCFSSGWASLSCRPFHEAHRDVPDCPQVLNTPVILRECFAVMCGDPELLLSPAGSAHLHSHESQNQHAILKITQRVSAVVHLINDTECLNYENIH